MRVIRLHSLVLLGVTTLLLALPLGCVRSEKRLFLTRNFQADSDQRALSLDSALPSELTLDQIVCITIRNNLDLKVKEWEEIVQREVATGAKLDMLPELLYSIEVTRRNNNPGSSSESLVPGVPPAPPSVSSEKHTLRREITLTWNLIDFGISYFKARQEANRILAKEFERERLKQNLILAVVEHFWKAAASKVGIEKTEALLRYLYERETVFIQAVRDSFISHTRVLELKDQILEQEANLMGLRKEYHAAFVELFRLMGIPPQEGVSLVFDRDRPASFQIGNIEELERAALRHRPELYGMDLEEKIGMDEVRVAALQYIPGVELFASSFYDQNRFLVENYWNLVGARAIWDLFSVPVAKSRRKAAEKHVILTQKQRLALSLGALTQVHLAHLLCQDNLENYLVFFETHRVRSQLFDSIRRKVEVGSLDEADLLQFHSDLLEADIDAWKAYGDLQFSLEQLNNAMGTPLMSP